MNALIIFTVLAALGSAAIYIFTGLYANLAFLVWFPIVVFFVLWALLFVVFWCFIMLTSWMFSKKKPQKKPSMFAQYILSEVSDIIKFFLGIHVKMSKEDKKFFKEMKKNKTPYIVVANHTSNLDQFLLWSLFRGMAIVALSKPEIQNIPIIGSYSYKAGNISINRDNPMQALKGISKSVSFLKDNPTCSLSMFPEGTRCKDGVMGEFHATTFIIPDKVKNRPILLLTIQNANAVKDRLFRFTKVYMDIVKVIPVEDIEKMSSQEMSDTSRAIIKEHLDAHVDRLYKTK